MARPKKDDFFVKKPIYPGGLTAMRQLIRKELKMPAEALKEKIEGSVYIRYGIDYNGMVSEVKILQSLGYGCDEEAERVVRLFKFKVPKIPRKLRVAFNKTIRIHFKLPKKKPIPPKKSVKQSSQRSYSYQIVKEKSNTQAPSVRKPSYTYTIKY